MCEFMGGKDLWVWLREVIFYVLSVLDVEDNVYLFDFICLRWCDRISD